MIVLFPFREHVRKWRPLTRLNRRENLNRSLIRWSMSGRLIDQADDGTARSFVGDVVRSLRGSVGILRRIGSALVPLNPIASRYTVIPLR